ncbi:MAG: hypothetical protein CMK09_05755 [Ponticaulis sp.]|nr:hypothetical protein [Ponticaulis sp.]
MRDAKNAAKSSYASNAHEQRMWREVTTPEGAVIRLRLADASERAVALLIDAAIMLATLIIGFLLIVFGLAQGTGSDWYVVSTIVFTFFFFLLRGFYFTIFEMGRRAATPGKRIMRLRVVARDGRQLTANAIFARNVMRELEVFLPFSYLFFGGRDEPLSALTTLVVLVWLGVFVFMPIFNRDKLRAGDIVAGTWVIRNPKLELAKDISSNVSAQTATEFQFTTAQLTAYGEHELQVLEDVLRTATESVEAAVAERIRNRIGWEKGPAEQDREFLDAFYKALRQTLETRMLFGQRKKDKFDDGSNTPLSET